MPDILQERRPLGSFADRRAAEPDPELLSPATQVIGDKDTYLGIAASDIGRRIADDQIELFVACPPAEAMLQHFALAAPDFIAIHDIGTSTSARLLAAVATASSRKLQKLVIRRQGYGVALATLQFVELPLLPGRNLRIYGTQIDADTQTRHQLAQLLLAHSRLAVVMIGELPAHALDSSLQPLREAIAAGPWPNRQMLLLPLAPAATLPAQAATLAGHSGVMVRTTPQAGRPAEAWSFISGAWNRLSRSAAQAPPTRPSAQGFAPSPAAAAPASTQPLGLNPMPRPATSSAPLQGVASAAVPAWGAAGAAVPALGAASAAVPALGAASAAVPAPGAASAAPWQDYVRRCAAIEGVLECCVFDIDQQRSLAHSGTPRMAERLAAKGAMLHAVVNDCANVLGLGPANPDVAITLAQHVLLLRPLPGRPGVALHLLIDHTRGNIGLARAQLQQIDLILLGSTGH